jgi:hypothetical protein
VHVVPVDDTSLNVRRIWRGLFDDVDDARLVEAVDERAVERDQARGAVGETERIEWLPIERRHPDLADWQVGEPRQHVARMQPLEVVQAHATA